MLGLIRTQPGVIWRVQTARTLQTREISKTIGISWWQKVGRARKVNC